MNFASDNAAGASPEILAALEAANTGAAGAYGADPITERLVGRFAALFETDVAVFPVATGTAANALALAVLTPPFGAVFCHENAHVEEDECGAPEFYTGGAKVVGLAGACGRIAPEALAAAIGRFRVGFEHHAQPAAISLTQATEWGGVYRPAEIAAIAEVARRHDLALHMDGARFANAVAHLDCAPADITWRAGIDVLSFGATKNGALAAEAVVFFQPDRARDFRYRRKRGGHLLSKMRYLSAQLEAYLADDLWLANAAHANAMASRLAAGLEGLPGTRLLCPVQANQIFVQLPSEVADGLLDQGYFFHPWPQAGANGYRLVTAFDTDPADVDGLIAAATGFASPGTRPYDGRV